MVLRHPFRGASSPAQSSEELIRKQLPPLGSLNCRPCRPCHADVRLNSIQSDKDSTFTGVVESISPPVPSWPEAFEPQHATRPSPLRAHAAVPRELSSTTPGSGAASRVASGRSSNPRRPQPSMQITSSARRISGSYRSRDQSYECYGCFASHVVIASAFVGSPVAENTSRAALANALARS